VQEHQAKISPMHEEILSHGIKRDFSLLEMCLTEQYLQYDFCLSEWNYLMSDAFQTACSNFDGILYTLVYVMRH